MIDLDARIERLQTELNTMFTGLGYTAYHRAFVNLRDGQRVPETQTASTTEYVDRLLDTGVSLSFFVVDPDRTVNDGLEMESRVYLYYAVDLNTLYSTVTERAEEYLIRDVIRKIKYSEFRLQGVKTGLTAFTDDFDFVKEGDNLEPYFLCRFDTLVTHTINEC